MQQESINTFFIAADIENSPNDLVEVAASRGGVGESETNGLFGVNHEDCPDL
jgi:hypothetical protein